MQSSFFIGNWYIAQQNQQINKHQKFQIRSLNDRFLFIDAIFANNSLQWTFRHAKNAVQKLETDDHNAERYVHIEINA